MDFLPMPHHVRRLEGRFCIRYNGCIMLQDTEPSALLYARMLRDTIREETGLDPDISWSDTGKIQLGNEVTVTLTTTVNLGLFGEFASFPVTLTARATGVSEVYWK